MKKTSQKKPCAPMALSRNACSAEFIAGYNAAKEAAATMADALGSWGYYNDCPHTERDGYVLAGRIRRLQPNGPRDPRGQETQDHGKS